jgi:small subunit ribosomal protein S16
VAVKIRLKRLGKIRAPYYRVVVADSRTKRDGRAIEEIGKYHPTQDPSLIEVDSERAQYWLSVGAQPTEPVAAILKVTGDWQKFKNLPGAEGTLRVADTKVDKVAVFEAAAKETAGEAKEGATTPKKKAAKTAKKSAAVEVAAEAAEGTPGAARPTADEAAAAGDVRAAGSGAEPAPTPATERPAAETPVAETTTAEPPAAESQPAETSAAETPEAPGAPEAPAAPEASEATSGES